MPLDATASSSSRAPQAAPFSDVDVALVMLGHALRLQGYAFSAVTSTTHARHRARLGVEARAASLTDIFGWNLPFAREDFPSIADHLDAAGLAVAVACADDDGGDVDLVRSAISFCTVDGEIVAHGTSGVVGGAVVLTPDRVRTSRVVGQRLSSSGRVLVQRAGSGLVGARLASSAARVIVVDQDPEAQRLCRINAALAGVEVVVDDGTGVDGTFDVIVVEASASLDESVDLVCAALPKLAPGGRLLVTTRTPVVDGVDIFRARVAPLLEGRAFSYDEVEADLGADDGDGACERIAFCVLELTAPKLRAVVDEDSAAFAIDGDFI